MVRFWYILFLFNFVWRKLNSIHLRQIWFLLVVGLTQLSWLEIWNQFLCGFMRASEICPTWRPGYRVETFTFYSLYMIFDFMLPFLGMPFSWGALLQLWFHLLSFFKTQNNSVEKTWIERFNINITILIRFDIFIL